MRDRFQAGTVIKERFRPVALAGEGWLGVTWRAVDLLWAEGEGDERPFAFQITWVTGRDPEMFMALQAVTARQHRMGHPNVLTAYAFDWIGDPGVVTIVTEWANCESLAVVLGEAPHSRTTERDLAIAWIGQLVNRLEYAHAAGLVNGNLHPGKCRLGKGSWTPEGTPLSELEIKIGGFTTVLPEDSPAAWRRRSAQPPGAHEVGVCLRHLRKPGRRTPVLRVSQAWCQGERTTCFLWRLSVISC